jgi:hypothetical protein
MVAFEINAKTGLAAGTTIDNRAGIYFDDNAVVMTNTVENKIGSTTGVTVMSNTSAAVEIYPNPVTDELTIKTGQNAYSTMNITNTMGQVIMMQQMTVNSVQTQVNVNALPAGIYYITLRGGSGVKVLKFEKI